MWCLGIILHTLLVGYPPFQARSQIKIESKVLFEPLELESNEDWLFIRDVSLKNLVKDLLNKDASQRPSLRSLPAHPGVAGVTKGRNSNLVDKMGRHLKETRLKAEICEYLANKARHSEATLLKTVLQEADWNKTGRVSLNQFKKALQASCLTPGQPLIPEYRD